MLIILLFARAFPLFIPYVKKKSKINAKKFGGIVKALYICSVNKAKQNKQTLKTRNYDFKRND